MRWYRDKDVVQEGQNEFKQDGVAVEPGEYLLAARSSFPLDVGSYRIELYEGSRFQGYATFSIVPVDTGENASSTAFSDGGKV